MGSTGRSALDALRAKWTVAELVETFVELVGDFDDDCTERVAEWSAQAGDFLADARRLSERTDLSPTFAQVKWAARLHARFVDRDGWGETVADELERLIAAGDKAPPTAPRPAAIDEFDPDATPAAARGRSVRALDGYGSDDGVTYRAPGYRPSPDDDCDDEDEPPARPAPRRRWLG